MPGVRTDLDFDDALGKFRVFLRSQAWPTEIVWSRPGDIIRRSPASVAIHRRDGDGDSHARDTFDEGCRAGRGVSLEAVCTLGDATVAIVAFPSDDREAELLMYPSDGGVKMSAAIPRVEGTARWSMPRDG
jgi:hypothetical protein